MIQPITDFMRRNAAYCIQGPVRRIVGESFQIKERYFFNKNYEKIADLFTLEVNRNDKKITKSILQAANGLYKITEHHIDIIKLQKANNKKVKFPYMISSSIIYDLEEPVKRTLLMVRDGIKFLKSDNDGVLIYKKLKNFKTSKFEIHSPVRAEDCMFDVSKAMKR